jgi:Zn ribbon nucleic-acid-binding protein
MPFSCPACGAASLEITDAIELPGDSTWDEIALQLVACTRCGFQGAAVYQESRRGSLASEAVDHTGYRLPGETLEWLRELIAACPDPRNAACRCEAHVRLSQTDAAGQWRGVPGQDAGFAMVFARE